MPRSSAGTIIIYGDNSAANALIKKQNPEMTDELLAYSVAKMKEYGIVDSGDATTLGIGAMTDARMKDFFDKMVRAGVAKAGLDYRKCLHAAIRRQEGRARSAAEAIAMPMPPATRIHPPRHSSRCAASARLFRTARARSPGSISTSGRANSCRCSARRAAANPPRLRIIAGLSEPTAGVVAWPPRRRQRGEGRSASCSRSRR